MTDDWWLFMFPHDDGFGDVAFDGKLGLIAREHDARKLLQHRDDGAWRHSEREQTIRSSSMLRTDVDDHGALALREHGQRPRAVRTECQVHGGHSSVPLR